MFAVRFARWRALHLCRYAKAKKGKNGYAAVGMISNWNEQMQMNEIDMWRCWTRCNAASISRLILPLVHADAENKCLTEWLHSCWLSCFCSDVKKWANKLFQWTFVREIRMRNVMRIGHMWTRSYYVYVHICGLWIHDTIRSMLLHVGFLASLLSGLPRSPLL